MGHISQTGVELLAEALSPQWCSDLVFVSPTFAVWGTELPTCLYSSQLPSCSEVGTAPGRQLNRLEGSAGKWYQPCGTASFETPPKTETTTKLQGQLYHSKECEAGRRHHHADRKRRVWNKLHASP